MITCTCPECRMVWGEDRGKGDSPISPHIFCCPRCGKMAEIGKPLRNPEILGIKEE